MKDLVGYDIATYGIFLQREKRDFGELIKHEVNVSAIVTCHPTDSSEFNKVYFVFIEGKEIPDFKYPDHIRENDRGEKVVYIFRSSQFLVEYVDLLRNEKPITLWWAKNDHTWQLATAKREPVGEGAGER